MKKKIDYTKPGKPMTSNQFEDMVAQAEKGPFYPIETLKKEILKWKAKRKTKS